jgi:CRP/FNR family transcriptional regulator, cyclic AMP receptor protein
MRKILYFFGQLQDTDLQWLLDAGEPRVYAAGADLIQEGREVQELFILLDGELTVSVGESTLATLSAGEVVGEMTLIDPRPPEATVTASASSLVFSVSHKLVRSKLMDDAEFAARLYRSLCLFLVNRLNRADAMIGLGGRVAELEPDDRADELSPVALEELSVAGARFDWFLNHVERPSRAIGA